MSARPSEGPLRGLTPEATGHRLSGRQAAFTLVEMNIVLFCLLLIAAIMLPNVMAMQRIRDLKDVEGKIVRLPSYARNEAVKVQEPVRIRLQQGSLIAEQVATDGTATTLDQVALPADIDVTAAQLNHQTVDPGSWQWTAYPDGTSDSGGIQLAEGTATRSLVLTADGGLQWTDSPLPDAAQDQWPAGQLQHRT